jgi:exonuclease III
MLINMCKSFDIILVQEHWLTTNDLSKLNNIDANFTSFGVSAMNSRLENGILLGRTFGGTAILVNANLLKHVIFIESDQEFGRFVSIRFQKADVDIIITNVYFPYFKTSPDYCIDCCLLIANIERICKDFPKSSILVAGDFNFSCLTLH